MLASHTWLALQRMQIEGAVRLAPNRARGGRPLEGLEMKVMTSKITEPSLCTRLCMD